MYKNRENHAYFFLCTAKCTGTAVTVQKKVTAPNPEYYFRSN